MTCPTCGQAVEPLPEHVIAAMPGRYGIVARALSREPGATVERLIGALWDDDPDGGPEDARAEVHVIICRLRKRLAPYGYTIPHMPWGGTHTGRTYRIAKLGR